MSTEQPFGPNAWLVEEMYERYVADSSSVSEAWQEFFTDYKGAAVPSVAGSLAAPAIAAAPLAVVATLSPVPAAGSVPPVAPASPAGPTGEAIRGVGAAIVANMERSLTVPTATSYRQVPAKLLEVNRGVANGYLQRKDGGRVSFTHFIAYAAVRAIADHVPVMKDTFSTDADGKPLRVRHEHVNLGLAIDQKKADGTRSLVVPVIRGADTMKFAEFWVAYEEIIRRARTNKLTVQDFQGANVSLTNPGGIGTLMSQPRLSAGQGAIIGVGAIDYPAEFQGADLRALAELGVSKVLSLSSTYDHRIIQGAESGEFLARLHGLLVGDHDFYHDVFRSLDVPYEDVKWNRDVSPVNREESLLHKQMQVGQLIRVHRARGHLIADLDPLRWKEPAMHDELDPATYGLTIWDLDREFLTGGLAGLDRMPLSEILRVLRNAYCRSIGIEYMHIQDTAEQRWLQGRVEGVAFKLSNAELRALLMRLNAAEAFEKFLATKYVGTKRFGLEGAESAIPIMDTLLSAAADGGLDSSIIGMTHRGRLNVLANIVGKSYEQIFKEFEGYVNPDTVQGSGDVKYHLGAVGKYVAPSGRDIRVELAANPSHLETVDPVVLGMVRAAQDTIDPPGSFPVLPILIHGDAAFAGQGLVAECFAMSDIGGYRVGGTVHLVINNQIGFTTTPEFARSSTYCTDMAKAVQAPIFHVNGDDPEACVRVAQLAFDYRQTFHSDVVIDMVCYRRHGHNEGDDPSYTQPLMYRAIDGRRTVRKLFTESLVKRGDITLDEAELALTDFSARLQVALEDTRAHAPAVPVRASRPPAAIGVLPHIDTASSVPVLTEVFNHLTNYPGGFTPHPKLARQFEVRSKLFHERGLVEWATAEALALGTLLKHGVDVRLTGEDTRRGTFSQRHAALIDYETGNDWIPLQTLPEAQGRLWLYDSLLSEYAALGFEYGYSVANKERLVIWEAQFGDFINGAQIIIDQYLVAAEDKWGQTSGLVLLLPHGYEGQGPEHSSARIERFLTLCAEDNIQVVNATTAAQYFHLLRRQILSTVRKPLVVFTPKSYLRRPESRSSLADLATGSFQETIDDAGVTDPASIKRLVFCSGKVAFDALAERNKRAAAVAIIRVEQLFPFPTAQLRAILTRYPNAMDLVWLQEEPENMGPWRFVEHQVHRLTTRGYSMRCTSRVESGSPATGSSKVHEQELADLMDETFAEL